jgi:hypothetical protein
LKCAHSIRVSSLARLVSVNNGPAPLKVFTLSKTWERQTCRHSAYDESSTSPPSASIRLSFLQMFCTAAWLMWVQHRNSASDHGCRALQTTHGASNGQIKSASSPPFWRRAMILSLNCPRPANNPIQRHRKASDENRVRRLIAEARDRNIPQRLAFRQAFQTKLMQQNKDKRHG